MKGIKAKINSAAANMNLEPCNFYQHPEGAGWSPLRIVKTNLGLKKNLPRFRKIIFSRINQRLCQCDCKMH